MWRVCPTASSCANLRRIFGNLPFCTRLVLRRRLSNAPDRRLVNRFRRICSSFSWSIPEYLNIAHQVCERHQQRADQVAIYTENAAGDRASYRFAELKEYSDRLANALRASGVKRGDRVAIVLPQTIETIVAHLAIHKLGAVSLPLAILFGPEALEYRLRDSGACAAIVHASRYDDIRQLQPDLPELQQVIGCRCGEADDEFWSLLRRAAAGFEMVQTRADDPACLIYTSGTTGPPKGALVAHRAVIGNFTGFEMSQNFFPQTGDVFWTPADWAWTGGLWDALLPALNYGMPIVAFEGGGFDAERVCRLMSDYAVTNAFIPPTALKMLRCPAGTQSEPRSETARHHECRRAGGGGTDSLGA